MRKMMQDMKNQSFEKIYLLYGEEGYLRKQYKDKLKQAICGEDTMNYAYFEGKGIDLREVISMCDTMPFFADYRLVVVENSGILKTAQDEFAKYIEQLPDSTILLLVEPEVDKRGKLFKKIKEIGYAAEMAAQTSATLEKWVTGLFSAKEKKISRETLEYFLAGTGSDMNLISNEVEKLISYIGEATVITIEDINAICSTQTVSKIFDMVDAIGVKNRKKALKLYYDMIEVKEPPMRILYMLSRQFLLILQAKELSEQGMTQKGIQEKMKVAPFIVGKAVKQSQNFSIGRLKKALNDCLEMEESVKNGRLEDKIAVEMLLIKYS